jgi:hypothetical protein
MRVEFLNDELTEAIVTRTSGWWLWRKTEQVRVVLLPDDRSKKRSSSWGGLREGWYYHGAEPAEEVDYRLWATLREAAGDELGRRRDNKHARHWVRVGKLPVARVVD